MRTTPLLVPSVFLLALSQLSFVAAQTLSAPPKMLIVYRESVKVGRDTEHSKHESQFVAIDTKTKSPFYYLGLGSINGPSEAWYVYPVESAADVGAMMKRAEKDPLLGAEYARLARIDSDYISAGRGMHLVARPDLSSGTLPDVSKLHFFEVTRYTVRFGQGQAALEAAGKAFAAALKRTAPSVNYVVYQVIAGMPNATYFAFTSAEEFGDFDRAWAGEMAAAKAMTSDEQEALGKGLDAVVDSETVHLRVDPSQSYVPKETRDRDPEFWAPK